MRVGIVDLGSLSLRFDIFDLNTDKCSEPIHRYRSMPRLGALCLRIETLSRVQRFQAISSALAQDLTCIKDYCEKFQVKTISAVGTAALRESSAGADILAWAEDFCGFEFRLISGEEEARLTALGIITFEKQLPTRVVVIDIGGGSTEIALLVNAEVIKTLSTSLGALSFKHELFLFPSHIPANTIEGLGEKISAHLNEKFSPLFSLMEEFTPPFEVIGSSGTIRFLETLGLTERSSPPSIQTEALSNFVKALLASSLEQIKTLPNMEEKRSDVILPGSLILEHILKLLGAKQIRVSRYSLRHGLLQAMIK